MQTPEQTVFNEFSNITAISPETILEAAYVVNTSVHEETCIVTDNNYVTWIN